MFRQTNKYRRIATYASLTGLSIYISIKYNDDIQSFGVGFQRLFRTVNLVATLTFDYKYSLWKEARKRLPQQNKPSSSIGNEEEAAKDEEAHQIFMSALHTKSALKLLDLLKANGGIYIKLGQHLAALDYLVPSEYCKILAVLQNAAPQSSLEEVRNVIESDLKRPMESVFEEFDEQPIGTASLAQVHRARLKSGEEVAVKVQHKRLQKFAHLDIVIVEKLVKLIKWTFPEFEFDWLADEMRKNLPKELDFVLEGHNASKLASMLGNSTPHVAIPKIYSAFTSQRVLTMEFIDGAKITDVSFIKANKFPAKSISHQLTSLFCEMIFVHGFVHCDPHAGNILIRKRNADRKRDYLRNLFGMPPNWQIVLLDHGLYIDLSKEFRIDYAHLWSNILLGDEAGIKKYSEKLGGGSAHRLFSCMLARKSWDSISNQRHSSTFSPQDIQKVKDNAQKYFKEITQLLASVPRPLLLLLKTNDLLYHIEGTLETSRSSPFSIALYTNWIILQSELSSSSWISRLYCYYRYSINYMKFNIMKIVYLALY